MKSQPFKNPHYENQLFRTRLLIAIALSSLLVLALFIRLIDLQLVEHKRYTTLSEQNQFGLLPIEPNRGLIYDRNGIVLANNKPVFSLDITPQYAGKLIEVIKELQKIITINDDDIIQFYKQVKQHRPFEAVPLKYQLTDDEMARFYGNQYRFSGVNVNARMLRFYPLAENTAHAVGYIGRINAKEQEEIDQTNYSASNYIGKTGIEKYYETQLHGTVGYNKVEIDATGHVVRTLARIPPVAGKNIYLTIDSQLQKVADDAFGKERGSLVAIDPKTGEILAFVSHPGFDPNLFVKGISNADYQALQSSPDRPLFDRVLFGQFPLASTIKPFLALQALDTETVTSNFTIWDPGWFSLPNSEHIYHDWQPHGHGNVNIAKAIMVSCDTYFFTVGVKMGIRLIDDILMRFNFGSATGIDLPQESIGVIASPAWKIQNRKMQWYPGDTVNSSIGQGYMLATPLQLADAVATLANRGNHITPHLLLKYKLSNGGIVSNNLAPQQTIVLKNPANWDKVINAMETVVKNPDGTAYGRYGVVDYEVAGKTGTAQLFHQKIVGHIDQTTLARELRNHSLFIAFAPVDNPQIAVAVISEHSNIAVAIARKVIDAYLHKNTASSANAEKSDNEIND